MHVLASAWRRGEGGRSRQRRTLWQRIGQVLAERPRLFRRQVAHYHDVCVGGGISATIEITHLPGIDVFKALRRAIDRARQRVVLVQGGSYQGQRP